MSICKLLFNHSASIATGFSDFLISRPSNQHWKLTAMKKLPHFISDYNIDFNEEHFIANHTGLMTHIQIVSIVKHI